MRDTQVFAMAINLSVNSGYCHDIERTLQKSLIGCRTQFTKPEGGRDSMRGRKGESFTEKWKKKEGKERKEEG